MKKLSAIKPVPLAAGRKCQGINRCIRLCSLFVMSFCATAPTSALAEFSSLFPIYPPGCATVPDMQTALYGENIARVYEGRMALVNARKTNEKLDAIVAVYRVACAESNQSVIWLSFTIPPELHASTLYQMPSISITWNQDGGRYVSLYREPSVSSPIRVGEQRIGNTVDAVGGAQPSRSWIYILDMDENTSYWDGPIPVERFNDSFKLKFHGLQASVRATIDIVVPATTEVLSRNQQLPLNGRLSGNWVAEGAPDQGFMLAVSEMVGESIPAPDRIAETPLLLFLSWYTFDIQGKPLWLTGSAQFLPGASEVSLNLDLATGGKFMGAELANRTQAGSLRLRAVSCGQIDIDYDLSGVGLGVGQQALKRLFALELVDFSCSGGTGMVGGGS